MSAALKERRGHNDLDISDLGTPDTLRYNILTLVVNEEYDRAINSLKDFLNKDSEYANFKERIEKYILHAIDLIFAIRTKRNFPGANLLAKTKQTELRDKFREHFKELKLTMRKIESAQEDLRVSDIKSTTIFVKALVYSVAIVIVSMFALEILQGLGETTAVVVGDYIDKALNYAFKLLKL